MSSNMKKWLSLVTSLAVAFVMCLGGMSVFTANVYAEGSSDLEVYYNNTLVGEFYYVSDESDPHYGSLSYTDGDGAQQYVDPIGPFDYTAMNNKGNSDNKSASKGPAVKDIVSACFEDNQMPAFDNQKITFEPGDDYPAVSFIWSDLFNENRAYYPAERNCENGDNGVAVTQEELSESVPVPVIIESFSKDKKGRLNGQLSFGQLSPNERTKPAWQKRMIKIGSKIPSISITDDTPVPTDNVSANAVTVNGEAAATSGRIALGSEIQFGINDCTDPDNPTIVYPDDVVLYYTTDGSEPNQLSAIYNWYKQEQDNEYKYATVVADKVGEFKIQTKAYSYGKTASDTEEFNYSVTADLVANQGKMTLDNTKCVAGTKPSVTQVTILGGKQALDSKYYTISIPDTAKVGKYKATVTGKDLCTGTLSQEFTVIPAKAAISKIKKGKKKVTVTIKSQKASGVTKYQIAYKKAKDKKWKTTTTKSTKKTIKKLKKGKKYNFKVRAYGPTGYGDYSKVKTVKVK